VFNPKVSNTSRKAEVINDLYSYIPITSVRKLLSYLYRPLVAIELFLVSFYREVKNAAAKTITV
jgi:hypothetical protein